MVSTYQAGISRDYGNLLPELAVARRWLFDAVQNYCDDRGFLFIGRIKALDSAAAKLETGRYTTLLGLDDLVACSVIVPTIKTCPDVVSHLKGILPVSDHRGRPYFVPSGSFQFENDRLYLVYDQGGAGPPIGCEIQVMTILEFAWQKLTHDYAYKAPEVAWKRSRIAALLRAAVESLDLQVAAMESLEKALPNKQDRFSARLAPVVKVLERLQLNGKVSLPDPSKNTRRYAELVTELGDRTAFPGRYPERELLAAVERIVSAGLSSSATFGQICAHVASANRKDDDVKYKFAASSILLADASLKMAKTEVNGGVTVVCV